MKAERDIYMELFNISINTYYLWKKQGRPIISLLEKYFTKEDLEEFLVSGKIAKLDYVDSYLNNLNDKCNNVYQKIENMKIKYKTSGIDYESHSMFSSKNLYVYYLFSFLRKYKEEIKSFQVENFKANFIALALLNPFEFKSNGTPEPLTTFQILSILDELSSAEMHYFFNKYDDVVHGDLAVLS